MSCRLNTIIPASQIWNLDSERLINLDLNGFIFDFSCTILPKAKQTAPSSKLYPLSQGQVTHSDGINYTFRERPLKS